MSHDAFISHSTHDKTAADATCAALEASGVRCWIAPRDIRPGAEWGEAIIDAINHSRVIILVFSANANESPQIRREVERATNKGIPIIPLRIQDIAPTRSLEFFIGNVHWLDALTPPLATHLRQLVETVKALLQIDPTPPRIVSPSIAVVAPVSSLGINRQLVATIILMCLGLFAAAIGIWWFTAEKVPQPQATSSAPVLAQSPAQLAKAIVDPNLIGTFEHDRAIDDYDWRFVYSIAPDGTYRMVTTQEEDGTYPCCQRRVPHHWRQDWSRTHGNLPCGWQCSDRGEERHSSGCIPTGTTDCSNRSGPSSHARDLACCYCTRRRDLDVNNPEQT